MKIEHVAVYVSDLEHAREFFETYFAGRSGEKYHNTNTGLQTYFISFDSETRLEIMTRPNLDKEIRSSLHSLGLTHLAFSVGSKDNVDRLTEILVDEGYECISGPRTTGDGYYESCVRIFDAIELEITE